MKYTWTPRNENPSTFAQAPTFQPGLYRAQPMLSRSIIQNWKDFGLKLTLYHHKARMGTPMGISLSIGTRFSRCLRLPN